MYTPVARGSSWAIHQTEITALIWITSLNEMLRLTEILGCTKWESDTFDASAYRALVFYVKHQYKYGENITLQGKVCETDTVKPMCQLCV